MRKDSFKKQIMTKMKVRRNHVTKNIYPFESIAFFWSEIIVAAGDKKQIGYYIGFLEDLEDRPPLLMLSLFYLSESWKGILLNLCISFPSYTLSLEPMDKKSMGS